MKNLLIRSDSTIPGATISHVTTYHCSEVHHVDIDMTDSGRRCHPDFYSWEKGQLTINMSGLEVNITIEQAKNLLEELPVAIEEAEATEDD
jgi:hypothetical protein